MQIMHDRYAECEYFIHMVFWSVKRTMRVLIDHSAIQPSTKYSVSMLC